jgi:thioredoxin 1
MKHMTAVLTAAALLCSIASAGCSGASAAKQASASASASSAASAAASPAAAASAAPLSDAEQIAAAWYGQYVGTITANQPIGTLMEDFAGEKDNIYGTIDTDGSDYLELYFDETHDSSTDAILMSTYVTLKQDTLTAAGSDNWLLDENFTEADQVIDTAAKSGTDPVTLTLTGTYRSPDSTSDGFTWTIELTRTCEYVCSINDAPQKESSVPSSLSSLAMARGTSGVTKNIISAEAVANESNLVRIGSREELNNYLSQHSKVILIFWAEWCSPCMMQNGYISDFAEEFPDILFIKNNIDVYPDAAVDYGANSIPTMVFISNGQKVSMVSGGHAKSWYEDQIKAVFG